MNNNYLDDHLDEIRAEFKLLEHWVYLNAADQDGAGQLLAERGARLLQFRRIRPHGGHPRRGYRHPPVSAGQVG